MKVYYSALIDKSALSENTKLSKNLAETLKRNLKTRKSKIKRKEINTFIFLSAETQLQKTIDSKTMDQTQKNCNKSSKNTTQKTDQSLKKSLETAGS